MRHRTCLIGTLLVAAGLAGAAPAAAAVGPSPNPAGNGITMITGQCGGSPQSAETTTLVVNNNRSGEDGGWSAARIYGTHDVLVPRSFTVMLYDATNGSSYVVAQRTKGSATGYSVNCFFDQPATDPPETAGDLLSDGELTAAQLPAGVGLDDAVGLVIMVEAVAPNGVPFPVF